MKSFKPINGIIGILSVAENEGNVPISMYNIYGLAHKLLAQRTSSGIGYIRKMKKIIKNYEILIIGF